TKWMKYLNIRQEVIKILEEKADKNLFDLGCSNFLLNNSLKARETKAKMNSWDLIKIKSSCIVKEAISKSEWQHMEWEKIFVNDISDKGLVSKIYKELIKLNTQKTNNPMKKWAKDLNRNFSKEDIQMAKRRMKKCSTSFIIGEIQIKITRYHLTHVRMANINNSGNNRCWQGCGERGSLLH
ncbi:LORF2 protein, partial [Crocuta crocuta]